jgi:hypothetical protein
MATLPSPAIPSSPQPEEAVQDFQFPQREAAFFYGLFLRGHSAEKLRPLLERIVRYRRHVLAIFENLIGHDSATQKLQ